MVGNSICTATFGLPVGGVAVPVNKLGLLAPWLGVAALASLAALTVALVRRRGDRNPYQGRRLWRTDHQSLLF